MRAKDLRREYLAGVCRALADCVDGSADVRLHSERHGDELVLTFRVADADRFHAVMSAATASIARECRHEAVHAPHKSSHSPAHERTG